VSHAESSSSSKNAPMFLLVSFRMNENNPRAVEIALQIA
jgi:hypothetical protein